MKIRNVVFIVWISTVLAMIVILLVAAQDMTTAEAEDNVTAESVIVNAEPVQIQKRANITVPSPSAITMAEPATITAITAPVVVTESAAYTVTDEEREILYRIVEAEVTGEGDEAVFEAKKNVASCILVRVDRGWADGTVEGVVFEKKQFSPISDGRYWTVQITQQTRDAVDWVLENGATHSCEYFCTTACASYRDGFHATLTEAFRDGQHAYFYGKENEHGY